MSVERIPYRHREATRIALIAAAGAGPVGAFFTAADVASIAGIWGACLYSVAENEGCSLDKDTAIGICKSALLGMSAYYVGCKTATKFFLLIPGAGIIAAMGVSSMTNIIFTYRFVLTLCTIFSENKNHLNLENLEDNIKSMFKGNGALKDIKDIIDIYIDG